MADKEVLMLNDLTVQNAAGRLRGFSLRAGGGMLLLEAVDHREIPSLFRVIAGLEQPLEGSVEFRGRGIGLILKEDRLPAGSKVWLELRYFGKLNGIPPENFEHLMEALDLEGIYNLPCHALNPYEKTAFFLVLELALRPDLLLIEEPLAGLNPEEGQKLLATLDRYSGEGPLILLGTVNTLPYPDSLPRIRLGHDREMRPESGSQKAPDAAPISPETALSVENTAAKTLPDPVRAGRVPEPLSGKMSDFGGRPMVTLFLDLPVEPRTEYALRRIAQIKFFQPAGNGYEADVLSEDQSKLPSLLREAGLTVDAFGRELP